MTDQPERFPGIQGRCPACRGASLFAGSGGHVTCRRIDCPNPSAADELLHANSLDAPLHAQLQAAIKALGTSETELAQLRGQLADTARSRDEWKWRAEDAKRGTRCQRERAERAEAIVARVQALVDEYPVGLDTALLEEALDQPAPAATEATEHHYLSTGCLHGDHGYCQGMTGLNGSKRPGECKFCRAPCRCICHQTRH